MVLPIIKHISSKYDATTLKAKVKAKVLIVKIIIVVLQNSEFSNTSDDTGRLFQKQISSLVLHQECP